MKAAEFAQDIMILDKPSADGISFPGSKIVDSTADASPELISSSRKPRPHKLQEALPSLYTAASLYAPPSGLCQRLPTTGDKIKLDLLYMIKGGSPSCPGNVPLTQVQDA